MKTSVHLITAHDLHLRLGAGQPPPNLIDVRTAPEFQEVRIAGSRLMPLDKLDATGLLGADTAGHECVLICRSGNRARKAAERLSAAGLNKLSVLDGGLQAWEQAGLPVERSGYKAISLERQVRIAAGFLVLAGVGLGTWIHPAFYGLSGLVGAGLIIAGLTDWCGMGLLLAKAPWNRAQQTATTNQPARAPVRSS
jgi:rhodanese-related sulfurtransferase